MKLKNPPIINQGFHILGTLVFQCWLLGALLVVDVCGQCIEDAEERCVNEIGVLPVCMFA